MSRLESYPGWKATKLMNDGELLDFFSRYPIAGGDAAADTVAAAAAAAAAADAAAATAAAEAAAGGGNADEVNKDTGFTVKQQDQINRMLATNKRELRKENATLKESLDAVTTTLAEANEKLSKLHDASNVNGDDKDKDGKKPTASEERDNELRVQLTQVKKDSEEKIAALTSKVTDGEDKLVKTEQRRLTILRASAIKDALLSAGSVDPALQAQMFADRLEYSPENDTFMFRKRKKEYEDEGVLVSVSQGIKDELPDWCKKPIDVRSGSGGAHAEGKGKASADDLTQAKQKLDLLKKEAGESRGSTTSISKVQAQQHVVDKLEKELA